MLHTPSHTMVDDSRCKYAFSSVSKVPTRIMDIVRVWYGVLGEGGVSFVEIPLDEEVAALKDAIFAKQRFGVTDTFPATALTLYVARKADGTWLTGDEFKQDGGLDHDFTDNVTEDTDTIGKDHLGEDFKRKPKEIHMLVELPPNRARPTVYFQRIVMHEMLEPLVAQALAHYQTVGHAIQATNTDNCNRILDTIDKMYATRRFFQPFVCILASTGMGKSQLAFALGGRRPYFYWLATPVTLESQPVHRAFTSISAAFHAMVKTDDPQSRSTSNVLLPGNYFYRITPLWTLGLIRALLEYCSSHSAMHQQRRIIRFDGDDAVALSVTPCVNYDVRAVVQSIMQAGKPVPFFILDGMAQEVLGYANDKDGKVAGFMRSVFRESGLVVVVMSTDAKVTDVMVHYAGSRCEPHHWVTLVPRLPPYQVNFRDEQQHAAWQAVVLKFDVVEHIALHSRGLFSQPFVDKMVELETLDSSMELPARLDQALTFVRDQVYQKKGFLGQWQGRRAQMAAISYHDVNGDDDGIDDPRPAKRPRLEDDALSMHFHFANLVEDQIANVDVTAGTLLQGHFKWSRQSSFPAVSDDVLLYLSILGAKTSSSFQTWSRIMSTRAMIQEIDSFPLQAEKKSRMTGDTRYQNMVAQAMFSASRRNGVQGISLSELLCCLVGEFQGETWTKATLHDGVGHSLTVSDLLEDYADNLRAMSSETIPFLAPPNTTWPDLMQSANVQGCRFGHLTRAANR